MVLRSNDGLWTDDSRLCTVQRKELEGTGTRLVSELDSVADWSHWTHKSLIEQWHAT